MTHTRSDKPALVIVPAVPQPYDERKGRDSVKRIRKQLIRASVRYINEGQSATRGDRIREASDMSGVPRALLEVESRL